MAKQVSATAPTHINMVGEGTVFEGTLQTDSDVRVSGRISGTVKVGGRVIVAQQGIIEGEVTASEADVAGRVQGEVHVTERLVLRTTARIEGNVKTGRLIVEEGAMFNGECRMGQTGTVQKQATLPKEITQPPPPTPADLPRPRQAALPEDPPRPVQEPRPHPNDGGGRSRSMPF